MILYLDSSALVKRYVAEEGSEEVAAWSAEAEALATALIARVEVPAALAKARRLGVLRADEFRRAIRAFMEDWPDLVQLPLTEALAVRAADLAVAHGAQGLRRRAPRLRFPVGRAGGHTLGLCRI